ncbi:MAG: hypothetical protein AAF589_08310 [Planctomycetota bacterium]
MRGDRRRTAAVGYLVVQAALAAGWWGMLMLSPESRGDYWPSGWPEEGLLAFWLPDLLLFIGGSAASAWLVARQSRRQRAALWLTAGAAAYAGLFCVSLWAMTGQAGASAAAMAPAAVATCLIARALA